MDNQPSASASEPRITKIILVGVTGALLQVLFVLVRVDLWSFIIAIIFGTIVVLTRGQFLKNPRDRSLPAFLLGIIVVESVLILVTHI